MYKPRKPKNMIWPKEIQRYEKRLLLYEKQQIQKQINQTILELGRLKAKKEYDRIKRESKKEFIDRKSKEFLEIYLKKKNC